MRLPDLVLRSRIASYRALIQFEDEGGLFLGHGGLEAAFVEGAADGVDGVWIAVFSQGDEAGAPEEGGCCYAYAGEEYCCHDEKEKVILRSSLKD